MAHLGQLRLPAILHWDMSHFVVLAASDRRHLFIHDPAQGVRKYTHAEGLAPFYRRGTGADARAWLCSAPPCCAAFPWPDAVGPVAGLRSPLLQTLVLSLILQLYVLAAPLFMQLIVDEAVLKDDADLVPTLAAGFAMFLAINCGATLLRAQLLAFINATLGFQMGAQLFRHLTSPAHGLFREAPCGRSGFAFRLDRSDPPRPLRRRPDHRADRTAPWRC